MFRPIPTPFTSFQTSYGVANANIPDYTFAPTPLGQGGSGGGANAGGLGPDTSANVYASPIFQSLLDNGSSHLPPAHHNTLQPQSSHEHYGRSPRGPSHNIKMEQPSDLAQQEAAAREYKPELEAGAFLQQVFNELTSKQGPIVGEKKPSHAITEEYAKADPIYVAKTMVSPRQRHERSPIRGELQQPLELGSGFAEERPLTFALPPPSCWMAYPSGSARETDPGPRHYPRLIPIIVRSKGMAIVAGEAELARLTGLNEYLENVGGYSPYVFEDMVDVTIELMTEIIQAVKAGQDAMPLLMAKFNDEETSAPIVYHLRLLAASYLKGNLDQYEAYIPGDADSYCNEWILPVNREIDQVEVMLLFNILLKPADIVLEIAYLDRSEGDEVNLHRMPEEAKNKDPKMLGSIIHLLYRPGHYDLLYREDASTAPSAAPEPPAAPTSLQVNRVSSFSHQHEIQSVAPSLGAFSSLSMGTLGMIPGFEPAGFAPLGSPPAVASPVGSGYSPSSQSTWVPHSYSETLPSAPSPMSSQTSQPSPPPQQSQDAITSLTSLRFSKHMFPVPGAVDASAFSPEPTFTTNIFKQSYFNTAHYNNPHFQPEEYKPDQDDEIPTSKSNGRKRST
ncbi:hypothetical protein JX266_000219 [Neoarthrinium moseri]|nr:hypothetical protein JX266_000219 [Neoarthrinium moseri]